MPPHKHYVEPYAGGLAVLLAKDPVGVSEVVNDCYGELINFWRVLQCPVDFKALQRRAQATPFSQEEWRRAVKRLEQPAKKPRMDNVDRAFAFFIWCRQSRAGQFNSFATMTKARLRRLMNEQASAWIGTIEGLAAVHARLQRVVIYNQDALKTIKEQDDKKTLVYADPPYLHETRSGDDEFAHEMTAEQHEELLAALARMKGKFLLSGYRSKLYDAFARKNKWRRHEFDLPNNAAGGRSKQREIECVWANY